MIEGIVRQRAARLQPTRDVIDPNKKEPKITPAGPIDPIQDTCSFVNGPDTRGVLSEANFGRAGDTQPEMDPCVSVIKLPVEKNIEAMTYEFNI